MWATCLLALLAPAVLVACGSEGGGEAGAETGRRQEGSALTSEDAARLAQLLVRTYEDGGADVEASADFSTDLSVAITGEVDFARHRGRLTLTSTASAGGTPTVEELVFEEDAVYDQAAPALTQSLAAAGRPGITWVRRSPGDGERPVDQVIGLLISLASTRPENPELLEQRGLVFERTEQVAGVDADVFRAPESESLYWISNADDRLLRFQGTLNGFSGPVVIDLQESGPRTIDLPPTGEVIDADEVPAG